MQLIDKIAVMGTIIYNGESRVLVQNSFIFSQTEKLDAIRSAIEAKGAQWTPKESWVTKLSPDEFRKLLGAIPGLGPLEPESPPYPLSYPAAIDWRNKDGYNWITSIKDQGENCGSCVAFGAVATLESLIRIELYQPDKNVDLSEMDVFMCGCLNCCGIGWHAQYACNYLQTSGAPDEECWPYQPVNQPCSNTCYNWQSRAVRIASVGRIFGQEACQTCVAIASILAVMAVYEDFDSYASGIYEHVWGEFTGKHHAVCIVGYDTTGPKDYWICKNSWGDEWGEDGFFRIKMGECEIETIDCYWMSGAILPSAPAAPSSLAATAVTDTQVNLTWHDNSNNESGFEVQRKE